VAPPALALIVAALALAAAPAPAHGARNSKRFGLGARVGTSGGVPVYADVDRWRYCPRAARRLTHADVSAAVAAALTVVPKLTDGPRGAKGHGTLVTKSGYAVHQCGERMRRRSVDVSIVLPEVTNSASLAQLDIDIARTSRGWVVFDRRH
jgi:hypothetical protein